MKLTSTGGTISCAVVQNLYPGAANLVLDSIRVMGVTLPGGFMSSGLKPSAVVRSDSVEGALKSWPVDLTYDAASGVLNLINLGLRADDDFFLFWMV